MAQNTAPIFGLTPNIDWAQGVATANTTTDLTSGTIYLCFTAGANGAYLDELRFRALGTNVATVIRVWVNNGSTTGTASNNTLIEEYTCSSTTASNTAGLPSFAISLRKALDASFRVYVTLGTAVAAGFDVTAFGLDY